MKRNREGMGVGPPPNDAIDAPSSALRILIVDDHAIVRDGLRRILIGKYPEAVFAEAQTAREALDQASKGRWDVILLDISLPDQSGLDVLKQLKEFQPAAKVLILTMHPEDQYAVRVLKSGASGYLTKETASTEVVQAVARVIAGGRYVSAALAEKLADDLNVPPRQAPHESLSDREFQVLRLLAMGKTSKEIAFDASLSIKTVSTYRTRMLEKLGLKTQADLIRYALREKIVE
jgi:DNA-binding NarL/FixJ family response regulator